MRPLRVRVVAGCVSLALAGVALAACSPLRVSITAVYLEGGAPAALFQPCRGSSVAGITIYESEGGPHATASRFWHGGDLTRDRTGARPIQVRLLELPAGWVQQQTRQDALITSFVDGRSYAVLAKIESNAEIDGGVEFKPLDLRSLGEGQVWAAPTPRADGQAMSVEEFRRSAADSC